MTTPWAWTDFSAPRNLDEMTVKLDPGASLTLPASSIGSSANRMLYFVEGKTMTADGKARIPNNTPSPTRANNIEE